MGEGCSLCVPTLRNINDFHAICVGSDYSVYKYISSQLVNFIFGYSINTSIIDRSNPSFSNDSV